MNIVIAAYFNSQPDPQRRRKWLPDYGQITALAASVRKHHEQLVLLHDCFDVKDSKNITHVKVQTTFNPYFQRWLEYYRYLRDHPEIENVFIVDATDVIMVNNPFKQMQPGKLYVGDEPQRLYSPWIYNNHKQRDIALFIRRNRNLDLLNCGVVGGSRQDIMQLCHDIFGMYFDKGEIVGPFEMGAFNYICRTKYNDKLVYGRQVTSIFKSYKPNGRWWFAHK
jgi:hypothetical protein